MAPSAASRLLSTVLMASCTTSTSTGAASGSSAAGSGSAGVPGTRSLAVIAGSIGTTGS